MKGASSHDGKMSGNVQMIDRYDQSKGKKKQTPKATGGDSGGEHEASGHDEIKQVVAEHGPAHSIEMKHDHEAGTHHVTSHHEDGYSHGPIEHSSAAMAHAHAAHAGGVSDGNELKEAHEGMQEQDTLQEAGHRSSIERNSHRAHAGGGLMPEHSMAAEG